MARMQRSTNDRMLRIDNGLQNVCNKSVDMVYEQAQYVNTFDEHKARAAGMRRAQRGHRP
jgi:hypothetical protein